MGTTGVPKERVDAPEPARLTDRTDEAGSTAPMAPPQATGLGGGNVSQESTPVSEIPADPGLRNMK